MDCYIILNRYNIKKIDIMKKITLTLIAGLSLALFALYNNLDSKVAIYKNDNTLLYDNVTILSTSGISYMILTQDGQQLYISKDLVKIK